MKLSRRRVRPAPVLGRRRKAPRGRTQVAVALGGILWIAGITAVALLRSNPGAGPEAPPLPRIPCPGPEIGVHASLAFDAGAEHRAETVAAIHRFLRPQVVRDSLLWSQIEPVEGRRNWSRTDSIVEELRTAGIEPLLVVFSSPPWANGVSQATPGHHVHVPPRGAELDIWLGHYSDFLAAAVRRYRDYVRRWEIWNEPNLAAFWRPRPDPAAYREVYEILRATILRVDPKAEVAVGGLTGLTATSAPSISGLAFLRHLTGTGVPIDSVAIHPYTTDEHPPDLDIPGENNFSDIARVRDHLVAEGERASIWVTEWGWSSSVVGEPLQAQYVERSLTMLERRYRFVRVATYFLDQDLPPRFLQGLLDQDLEPKPAAPAFRQSAERLAAQCRAARAAP
jgi:hypothetical protein